MQGITLTLIVVLVGLVLMTQPETGAAKVPRSFMDHLQMKRAERERDTHPGHVKNVYDDDDYNFSGALWNRKRNSKRLDLDGYWNSKKMTMKRSKSKRSPDAFQADLEQETYVDEEQLGQQQPRPGCCQCGDHYCCNSMCHGK